MLVLTRKVGERIKIGGEWVKVIAVRGSKVTLGVEADPGVPVYREELLETAIHQTEEESH